MISSLVLAAAFHFANVCSDDMVLQRDVDVPVWGFGEKGKTVEVALNGKKVGKAVVGEDERWTVKIPAQKANRKPSKIAAKCGSEKREITGVLFGGWRVPMHKRGGWAYRADNDPETWETVWIGIDKGTVPDHMRKIISIAVQFQMMPAEHSGLAFRNFRLEEGE